MAQSSVSHLRHYNHRVSFKDHFSGLASDYARYRPTYPPELAAHLAGIAPSRALALDLATGNGQAAVDLALHFDQVLASDASARQLAEAAVHQRVSYLRHPAERLPVRSASADLIAVAQAAHWLDFERFYGEAQRVLRPGGIVALWTYGLFQIEPRIDAAIAHFYGEVVGPYWPPERRYIEEQYRTLPFPLTELPAPVFEMSADWSLAGVISYLGTWSAVDRYRSERGGDPLPLVADALRPLWPDGGRRHLRWPLYLRTGRF
jgi:SAM-dependent methyltransferase